MRVWVLKAGEPVPHAGSRVRPLRARLIGQYLAGRGHEVTWWTSTFDHRLKRHVHEGDAGLELAPGYRLRALRTPGYRRNHSLARCRDAGVLAARFLAAAGEEPVPDLIVSAMPTLELCEAAVRFGEQAGVPVAVDIRDLWPDIFVELLPRCLRWSGKLVFAAQFRSIRRVCAGAAAILGISPGFVQWGLQYARRAAREGDRSFFLAYPERQYPAADLESAHRALVARGVIRHGRMTACYVGSITDRVKAELRQIVDAAAILRARGADVGMVVCGSGPALEHLRKAAAGLENCVLPGFLEGAELQALLAHCGVGLIPFPNTPDFRMSMPNKAAEYFSAGMPVATSCGGTLAALLRERDCGLQYGSAEDLAALLLALRGDPGKLSRWQENARDVYRAEFRADAVYSDMAAHLEGIAGAFPGGVPSRGECVTGRYSTN